MFENLSVEGRLTRILAAIVRHSGGEVRIPTELVDTPGEATTLVFTRDRSTQDFIIRGAKSTEVTLEIVRVTPERSATRATVPVIPKEPEPPAIPTEPVQISRPPLNDADLGKLEGKLRRITLARQLAEEMERRRRSNHETPQT